MTDETIAETITQELAERELTLGTIECGVNGVVSRHLFDTDEGPNVLGNSLIADDVDYAIGLMDLPRPQFKSAGEFSAKAARAAAREGCDFLGVDICLAVWGRLSSGEDSAKVVHIALNAGNEVIDQTFEVEGTNEQSRDEVARRALNMLRDVL
ncbi:MAG: CinA family protein [Anaerolineae bacterium]|jgi:nicotinamide mononucleotide (NMN) deamidase PncC